MKPRKAKAGGIDPKAAGKEWRERGPSVIGDRVAKGLLRSLREDRQHEASAFHYRTTETIEWWEDAIRGLVHDGRRAHREALELDADTEAALGDVLGHVYNDDAAAYRRRFALRAIKAVCRAYVMADPGRRPVNLAVELREMNPQEIEAELVTMRLEGVQ